VTAKGYIGMASRKAQQGAIPVLPYGYSVPRILRPRNDRGYMLVGEVYVQGIMQGEAECLKNGDCQAENFDIL
jgi:hypothetical protein